MKKKKKEKLQVFSYPWDAETSIEIKAKSQEEADDIIFGALKKVAAEIAGEIYEEIK